MNGEEREPARIGVALEENQLDARRLRQADVPGASARHDVSCDQPYQAGLAPRLFRVSQILACLAILGVLLASVLLALGAGSGLAVRAAALLSIGALVAGLLIQRFLRAHVERLQAACHRARQFADLHSSIIASFAMAIDAKDQHTHGHTQRVRDMALMIAEEMGLSEDEKDALTTAAMLHDIGKLAVPDYILSKPGQLTDEEMKKVQTHTIVGAAILESVKFPWPVVPAIRHHHEWYDGTGYPDRLKGDQIPLAARVLAVADVYDALLSHRPYRPAMTVQAAVKFMRDRCGSQFDPDILNTCFRVLSSQRAENRFGFIFNADGSGLSAAGDASGQRAIFQDIQQAHQELLALYEIVQTMGQSLNMEESADLIISKTKRIIDFATCVLYLTEPDDGHVIALAASGPHAESIQGRRLPLGSGVSGTVALSGIAAGAGHGASEDLKLLLGSEADECFLTEVLSAPLPGEEGPIGAITLYRPKARPFTEDDARLASTIARQAAIAINNARQYEQTEQSALTDELTGLFNSRYFFMALEEALGRAREERTHCSLMAVDLDNLKVVNDNFGHQQGDRVLRITAEIFKRHVRETDTVVRYAGDEFFVIFPKTGNKQASETADRIKQAVRETSIEMPTGRTIKLSASFGVATFPGDAEEAQSLIAVADRAMYADKRLSRQLAILVGQREDVPDERTASPGKRPTR